MQRAGRDIRIEPAAPGDAVHLGDLALRSKALWGYTADFLDACRDELSVDPDRIADGTLVAFVARLGDRIAGFYSMEALDPERFELEALFVEPAMTGRGIGRALLAHALEATGAAGAGTLVVQSDPHAEPFYLAAGGRPAGRRASGSVPGRSLPVIEFRLAGADTS